MQTSLVPHIKINRLHVILFEKNKAQSHVDGGNADNNLKIIMII